VRLAMPLIEGAAHGFVEARDVAKRYVVTGTVGGATHRWRYRRWKKLSAEKQWRKLFPGFRRLTRCRTRMST
jgi:hypothetical protein